MWCQYIHKHQSHVSGKTTYILSRGILHIFFLIQETFEDTKGLSEAINRRQTKFAMANRKRGKKTSYCQQKTALYQATRIQLITGNEPICSDRVSSACFIRETPFKYPVTSHERGEDFTTTQKNIFAETMNSFLNVLLLKRGMRSILVFCVNKYM